MPSQRFVNTVSRSVLGLAGITAMSVFAFPGAPLADGGNAAHYNLYGMPGIVDMPSAEAPADAELMATVSGFGDTTRTTLAFQITPRLTGSFRYASIQQFPTAASVGSRQIYYDRSFDLQYQVLTEGRIRPAVALGLRDMIGTALYGGEYVVATKTLAPGLKVSGGIGWGRLGSYQPFGETGSRPTTVLGKGGVPTYDRWFRGDVAGFGGVTYAPNDRLSFKLEYSSDDYVDEQTIGRFDKKSPWNYGIDYRFRNGTQLSLYHLYGSEVGAQISLVTNPRTAGIPGGIETAPLPVAPRAPGADRDLGWTQDTQRVSQAKSSFAELAAGEGLVVEAVKLEARRATVRLVNPRYGAPAQAIGRTARAMSRALPASVEEFEIIPVVDGMPMSSVILRRSDLERHEHDAADVMLAKASIRDAFGRAPRPDAGLYPKFTWSLAPYLELSVFDPDNPVRADSGLRATGKFEIAPNVILSGSITKKATGNLDETPRRDSSGLPRVRTDYGLYALEGDPSIEFLQAAFYGRPATNVYSRFTLGYLEEMYAGASAEVLWKPVQSRLALGAELNYILRRDFDQLFGVQDMVTIDPNTGAKLEIPNVNGHVSAYYDFGNGFHGQLDVGRYLAGDYGATVSLDREFANGWRVGAYATVTNASAEAFGEGSFDKGLRFSVPLTTFLGTPSREVSQIEIQSLSRDGGARLNVRGRLYNKVREYHEPEAAKSWGRFWR